MRKIFIFSCLLVLTGLCASSQPWKKGGGGASPASATPATAGTAGAAGAATPATSGTSQTGYVYRLKAGKHLQYASLKSETHYFLRSALPARILGLPVQSGQLITASIILDRKANAALLQSGIRSFQEYDIRSIVKQVSCKPAPPGSCTAPGRQDSTASQGAVASQPSSGGTSGASGAPDTALAVTILYYNSLPRFTDHGLHSSSRRIPRSCRPRSSIENSTSTLKRIKNIRLPTGIIKASLNWERKPGTTESAASE